MKGLQIGFAPLARTTFDIPLATEVSAAARQSLVNGGMDVFGPQALITDLDAARELAAKWGADPPDLLLVLGRHQELALTPRNPAISQRRPKEARTRS